MVFATALRNGGQIPVFLATPLAEPAPLADTPPSASRCPPMLSGDAPTIGAAK